MDINYKRKIKSVADSQLEEDFAAVG